MKIYKLVHSRRVVSAATAQALNVNAYKKNIAISYTREISLVKLAFARWDLLNLKILPPLGGFLVVDFVKKTVYLLVFSAFPVSKLIHNQQ